MPSAVMSADSGAAVVKLTISIPRESCTSAKAKYSSSVVPPDPSVHFYYWLGVEDDDVIARRDRNQSLFRSGFAAAQNELAKRIFV